MEVNGVNLMNPATTNDSISEVESKTSILIDWIGTGITTSAVQVVEKYDRIS